MKKRKLNYIFHDPNPVEVTAGELIKVLIEVNTPKVEAAIQCVAENCDDTTVKEDIS